MHRNRWMGTVVGAVAIAALLGACGGSDGPRERGGGHHGRRGRAPESRVPARRDGESRFQAEDPPVKQVAAKEGADLTVIDSQLDAQKQVQQLQDLAATKKYDGIVVVPLNGAALVPAVRQALDTGIAIGAADVPIGPDATSSETQVEGVAAYSGRPFSVNGENLGKLTVEACEGKDPDAAFMYGVKALTYDQALFDGFRDAIAESPNVDVVAEVEGMYTREGGLKAAQDVAQAHEDLDVLAAVDQSALGAEAALKSAGMAEQVDIIGFGGARQAIEAVAAGRWFGDVVQVPRTEARLAAEAVVRAIRDGELTGYVDPVAEVKAPDDGRVTKRNAESFKAEYDG